jgi:vacuolar-type H+-ATPase subunit H
MERESFAEIVAVEKQVKKLLTEKERAAAELLARAREECSARWEAAEIRLQAECGELLAEADVRAREDAAQLLSQEAAQAQKLAQIGDDALRLLVRKSLLKLLPDEVAGQLDLATWFSGEVLK